MALADLFNFVISAERGESATRSPGGGPLELTKGPATKKSTQTASTFITPQVLAAYPLASGIVAGFWKGAERLFHLRDDSLWVCFVISMIVATFSFVVSITDPRLQATTRDKLIGIGFAVLNGFYLFTTAIGISMAAAKK
jgi:hypothetical protein